MQTLQCTQQRLPDLRVFLRFVRTELPALLSHQGVNVTLLIFNSIWEFSQPHSVSCMWAAKCFCLCSPGA